MKLIHFFKKHFTQSLTLLGIDLDQQSLRLIELNKINSTYLLRSCIQVSLPEKNVPEDFSWNHPEFSDFLKKTIQESNIKTRQVALALPHTSVLFKTIELDKTLRASEMMAQIRNHAEQYFNAALSNLMIDFEILGDSKHHPDLREVRWVAAKRLEVESRISVLAAAGLTASVVEVDSFSIQRVAIFFIKKNKLHLNSAAIIHIYFSQILLTVFHKKTYIYTRVENYDTKMDDFSALTHIIVRILNVFLSINPEYRLSLILLSGHHISVDLLSDIQKQTNIETKPLDIFSVLKNKNIDEKLSTTHFSVSVGLAMRTVL